jgi:AcrR family transcriptional regulator
MNNSDVTAPARPERSAVKATRENWLALAVRTLVEQGVDAVMILPLAKQLDVSRSSFYWYFRNREDLLDELLNHWSRTNTRAILDHASQPSSSVSEGVMLIFRCWSDESLFDPKLDFAVRNWARQSRSVRTLIDQADTARLAAIQSMFQRHGYGAEESLIRARVLYFMQVGYYMLEVNEAWNERLSHSAAYVQVFAGVNPTPAELRAFEEFVGSVHARRPARNSRRR